MATNEEKKGNAPKLNKGDKILGYDNRGNPVISRAPKEPSLPSDNPQLAIAVDKARRAGYSNADIANAAITGEPLLPSQSSQVRDFVAKAKQAGYSNADIARAVANNEPLLPSQSSQVRQAVEQAAARGGNAEAIKYTQAYLAPDKQQLPSRETANDPNTYNANSVQARNRQLEAVKRFIGVVPREQKLIIERQIEEEPREAAKVAATATGIGVLFATTGPAGVSRLSPTLGSAVNVGIDTYFTADGIKDLYTGVKKFVTGDKKEATAEIATGSTNIILGSIGIKSGVKQGLQAAEKEFVPQLIKTGQTQEVVTAENIITSPARTVSREEAGLTSQNLVYTQEKTKDVLGITPLTFKAGVESGPGREVLLVEPVQIRSTTRAKVSGITAQESETKTLNIISESLGSVDTAGSPSLLGREGSVVSFKQANTITRSQKSAPRNEESLLVDTQSPTPQTIADSFAPKTNREFDKTTTEKYFGIVSDITDTAKSKELARAQSIINVEPVSQLSQSRTVSKGTLTIVDESSALSDITNLQSIRTKNNNQISASRTTSRISTTADQETETLFEFSKPTSFSQSIIPVTKFEQASDVAPVSTLSRGEDVSLFAEPTETIRAARNSKQTNTIVESATTPLFGTSEASRSVTVFDEVGSVKKSILLKPLDEANDFVAKDASILRFEESLSDSSRNQVRALGYSPDVEILGNSINAEIAESSILNSPSVFGGATKRSGAQIVAISKREKAIEQADASAQAALVQLFSDAPKVESEAKAAAAKIKDSFLIAGSSSPGAEVSLARSLPQIDIPSLSPTTSKPARSIFSGFANPTSSSSPTRDTTVPSIVSGLEITPLIVQSSRIAPASIFGQKPATRSVEKINTQSGVRSDTVLLQKVGSQAIQKVAPSIITTPNITQVERMRIITPQRPPTPRIRIPGLDVPPVPLPKNYPRNKKSTKKSAAVFDVFTRKQGQLFKINFAPVSETEAKALGKTVVTDTARASFKIVRAGVAQVEDVFKKVDLSGFKKNKDGFYVEKNIFRINTPGEVSQISKKGQRARKSRSIFTSEFKLTR